jgi:dipeptidyl-peptidase 4
VISISSCRVFTAAVLFLTAISFSHAQTGAATSSIKPLTVEDIFAHPSLEAGAPQGLTWSPDSKHLTYLDGGELLDLDPVTAKVHILVSRAKLASLSNDSTTEKDRDHRARYGMASYLWSPDSGHLLFDSNGRLWLYDLKTGTGVNIGSSTEASGDDPKFSSDGKYLSYVKDHGVSVIRLRDANTPVSSVTASGNAAIMNGEVDWVYQEELETRSNYFWSPDSAKIAYLQMDETNVPEYPITDWIPTHALVDHQRYPQAGDPNPVVRVGVVNATGGKTIWIKLPIKEGDDYIPRFGWADRKTVWIETLARDHQHMNLYFADPVTGRTRLVLEQKDEKFFNDKYNVEVSKDKMVLTSWADGHTHIYLYSFDANNPLEATAKLERQLTKGDFDVDAVLSVDAEHKLVYFASNEGNPTDQQLWQVSFDGEKAALTATRGVHAGSFAPSGGSFVDTFSSRATTPTMNLCHMDNGHAACSLFWASRALETMHVHTPEEMKVTTPDGITLYATLQLPEGKLEKASVPLIINPYGGPGVMTVQNRWGGDRFLFDELLTQHGFAVLHTDGRGMRGQGRDFEQAAYHNFGPAQLQDQLTVADAVLEKYPQLDAKRQGWWGWSWGGTFTLYALSHSDRFRAGVSVAPVTDWRNYDSVYTERYMSTPAAFTTGYKDFSVINTADKLHGHILLVQGTGDDNVHFANMVQYIQQLTVNNIPYDLQIYPRKTHSIAGTEVRPHLFNRILAQFEMYLKPPVESNGSSGK